jgi:hypothetical protein
LKWDEISGKFHIKGIAAALSACCVDLIPLNVS